MVLSTNGTLHVHLRFYGLTMAAAWACPLSPRDRRVSHSSFYRSEGCSRAPPLRPLCALDPHFCRARTGRAPPLLPDSQSGIASRECGLRGRGFRVLCGTGPTRDTQVYGECPLAKVKDFRIPTEKARGYAKSL